MLSHFSHIQLFATLWMVARHAPLSMRFSRQEYRSGLRSPPPGDLPYPGIKPMSLTSPALAGGFFTTSTTWEAHIYLLSIRTLTTSCEELTRWKRLWCWEGLEAGEGDDRGWDSWKASLTRWAWVWVNSGSWWWTGKPGMLQFMGSQRWGTELTETWKSFRSGSALKNPPAVQETQVMWFHPCIRKISSRRAWQLTPVFLPGESHR